MFKIETKNPAVALRIVHLLGDDAKRMKAQAHGRDDAMGDAMRSAAKELERCAADTLAQYQDKAL